jgi:hypothetical protein
MGILKRLGKRHITIIEVSPMEAPSSLRMELSLLLYGHAGVDVLLRDDPLPAYVRTPEGWITLPREEALAGAFDPEIASVTIWQRNGLVTIW